MSEAWLEKVVKIPARSRALLAWGIVVFAMPMFLMERVLFPPFSMLLCRPSLADLMGQ